LLAVPALAFMLNRAVANPAIELSHSSLQGMGAGLKAHLTANPGNEKDLTQKVKDYLEKSFVDINQVVDNAKASDIKRKMAKETQDLISDWVDAEVDESVALAELPGHKRWVENARQVFGKAPLQETENPNLLPEQKLSALRSRVENAIWDFNREHRINGYEELHGLIKDATPLNNTAKTWFSYSPDKILSAKAETPAASVIAEAKKGLQHVGFGQIKNDVSRVGGFIKEIQKNHAKDTAKPMGEVVESTMKQLVGRKWIFGTSVTLLTAAYLVKLAFWAQNHGTYQATRLLNDSASKSKHKNQKGSEGSHGSNAANPQLQAGLPFGSQPAFSQLAAMVPHRSPLNQAFLNNRFAQNQPVWTVGGQA